MAITSTNQGAERASGEEGVAQARGHCVFFLLFFTCLQIQFPFKEDFGGIGGEGRVGEGGAGVRWWWRGSDLAASFRDPVEYNIKPQGGEKTCSALK